MYDFSVEGDEPEAGAPEAERTEIEVTPDMIDAGVRALLEGSIDGEIGNAEAAHRALVSDIFRAMISLNRVGSGSQAL
jgi:hypothetical protein